MDFFHTQIIVIFLYKQLCLRNFFLTVENLASGLKKTFFTYLRCESNPPYLFVVYNINDGLE
ncbi:MAG TPA: hypothetical protein DSN98_05605 [Thermoplasmata archaeon]|nr:MAG TPA: hypothetical protein DSN98_05605 [Thermoplasmata archaeon]